MSPVEPEDPALASEGPDLAGHPYGEPPEGVRPTVRSLTHSYALTLANAYRLRSRLRGLAEAGLLAVRLTGRRLDDVHSAAIPWAERFYRGYHELGELGGEVDEIVQQLRGGLDGKGLEELLENPAVSLDQLAQVVTAMGVALLYEAIRRSPGPGVDLGSLDEEFALGEDELSRRTDVLAEASRILQDGDSPALAIPALGAEVSGAAHTYWIQLQASRRLRARLSPRGRRGRPQSELGLLARRMSTPLSGLQPNARYEVIAHVASDLLHREPGEQVYSWDRVEEILKKDSARSRRD